MERSRSQVLLAYMPDAVFVHESGLIARVAGIRGSQTGDVNRSVVLNEMDRYLSQWDDDAVVGIARPGRVPHEEFQFLTPDLVQWDLWPLRFECSRASCGIIRTFRHVRDVPQSPVCRVCGAPLRQLRYYSAHECGRIQPMFVPDCKVEGHGYEHVYFEDTGTFRTSTFRCRKCGNAVIRRTLQSPCSCPGDNDDKPMMRAFTVRDTRTYHPHRVTLINMKSSTYNELQHHPSRGHVAVASYLGVLKHSGGIREAIAEIGQDSGATRLSAAEWTSREDQLRSMGLSDQEIDAIRGRLAPAESGVNAVGSASPEVLELGASRRLVERAALFDQGEVARHSLEDCRAAAVARGEHASEMAIGEAMRRAAQLGIEDIAVTWEFPIAVASFGYTRATKTPGQGRIHGFARAGHHDGKYPVFVATTDTEAAIVTFSAASVLRWLAEQGQHAVEAPDDPAKARMAILEMFAGRAENPEPARTVETLIHTAAHALLLALTDGQVGFAEASLAEWVVPETLTIALYANNLKSYTLGALWTLLNNRTLQWLEKALDGARSCENDPLCHQKVPRACERCLYLTFGCQCFNENLDRGVLAHYWSHA